MLQTCCILLFTNWYKLWTATNYQCQVQVLLKLYIIYYIIVSNNFQTWKFRASCNTIACAIYTSTWCFAGARDVAVLWITDWKQCRLLLNVLCLSQLVPSRYTVTAFRCHVHVQNLFETIIGHFLKFTYRKYRMQLKWSPCPWNGEWRYKKSPNNSIILWL